MPETGRTVVTTGAGSGSGAAAVRAFAERGDRVWGTMCDAEGRNAARKAELEAHSPRVAISEMDVTSDAPVADGFSRNLAERPVDIPIDNAGIMFIGITEAYSVAQAHERMDTSHFGAIRAMQAVLSSMRVRGSGLIINIISIAGRVSTPFFGTCCAAKHALEAHSQSLRDGLAPFGIDVALVEPGPFPSNLLAAGRPPVREDVP